MTYWRYRVRGDFAQLLSRLEQHNSKGYFMPKTDSIDELTQDVFDNHRNYYYKEHVSLTIRNIFLPKMNTSVPEIFPYPDIDEIIGLMANSEGKSMFNCFHAYSINSNSQNKKLAWEFIKFLLSKKMQTSLTFAGTPVNKAAFYETSKAFFKAYSNADILDYLATEINNVDYLDAYNNYTVFMDEYLNNLDFCPVYDEKVKEIVGKEISHFFNRSMSAEEITNALQEKVQIYLNE